MDPVLKDLRYLLEQCTQCDLSSCIYSGSMYWYCCMAGFVLIGKGYCHVGYYMFWCSRTVKLNLTHLQGGNESLLGEKSKNLEDLIKAT